jgi:hypothetical protein
MSNGHVLLGFPAHDVARLDSFTRSIWIFLMITSRPPTAVTTHCFFTPHASSVARTASATMVGSMTSPSTIASPDSGVITTLVSSAVPFE